MSNLTGQVIGQYQIIEEIGRGGMAVIYRAEQPAIEREVAIKLLRQSLFELDQNMLTRFFREAQIVANLQHPHILPVYDFGEFNGLPYLVMAYMPSGTLADYIEQQGQLRLPEIVRLVRQIADALDYAHKQGVIHRDLKPSNILMDEPGNAYLADFGLAKAVQRSDLTASGLIGTPDYIAPDWAQGAEITPSVDIYALGVTLYQMLTGELPFQSTTPMGVLMAHLNDPVPDLRHKRPDLIEAIQPVIAIAMAKSADDRFASARELAEALEKAHSTGFPAISLQIPTPPVVQPPIFPAIHFYFNLLAARDVLGEDQLNGVLLLAGLENLIGNFESLNFEEDVYPVEKYAHFWKTILDVYGIRGLRSVGRLAGQRTQIHSLKSDKDKVLRQAGQALLRTKPQLEKMRIGLKLMAQAFGDEGIETNETEDYFIWKVHRCPNCWGWKAEEPVCFSWIGFLQAEISSGIGIQDIQIVERECRAMGAAACVFEINRSLFQTN